MKHFNTKHGMDGTPTYRTWVDMRRRCNNPKRKDYKNYGARGIRVCEKWDFGNKEKSAFECFLEDMGIRPEGKTLDRIDNSKGYYKENCRWASRIQQERNKRSNHFITVFNETMTIIEAAEKYNIKPSNLYNRIINLKWNHEDAVTRPIARTTKK